MSNATTPRVMILLAPGAEEMEAVIIIDVLRRAGVEVVVAGVEGHDAVACSRGVRLVPDVSLADVAAAETFDFIILPGGMEGTRRLGAAPAVGELLRNQEAAERGIGAICAAPAALAMHGVARGRRLTSHPAVEPLVASHGEYTDDPVVEDGPLITSRGPGTAFEFALALAARLVGREAADALRGPMIL